MSEKRLSKKSLIAIKATLTKIEIYWISINLLFGFAQSDS